MNSLYQQLAQALYDHKDTWDYPIEALRLEPRATKQLKNNGVETINDIYLKLNVKYQESYDFSSTTINMLKVPIATIDKMPSISDNTITQLVIGLANIPESFDLTYLLTNFLAKRELEILDLRFGLATKPHTLDSVGRMMGLTRERIRQLELKAINKLKPLVSLIRDDSISRILDYAKENGTIDAAPITISSKYRPAGLIRLIIELMPTNLQAVADARYNEEILCSGSSIQVLVDKLDAIDELLMEQVEYVDPNEVSNFIGINTSTVISNKYLIYKGQLVAHSHNRNIFPTRKEIVYDALLEIGKPATIAEIAELTGTSLNVVRGTLNHYRSTFANVGRSTYGLKDWGYSGKHTAEIVFELLAKNKRPLAFREVYKYVKSQKNVGEGTVYAGIGLDDRIIRTIDNEYALRSWGVPEMPKHKTDYDITLSAALLEIFHESKEPLDAHTIQFIILNNYSGIVTSNMNSISATLSKLNKQKIIERVHKGWYRLKCK